MDYQESLVTSQCYGRILKCSSRISVLPPLDGGRRRQQSIIQAPNFKATIPVCQIIDLAATKASELLFTDSPSVFEISGKCTKATTSTIRHL